MKNQLVRKPMFALALFCASLTIFSSCKKQSLEKDLPTQTKARSEQTQLEASFAKILVQALKSDPDLRAFIKEEALKQFDNDYDVLYQLVRDKEINKGETLRTKLLKFTTEAELLKIENHLPTLTLFVPTLPNFNPETWNTASEIPSVAIANLDEKNTISLYTSEQEIVLKPNELPGFAVLVVKQNERVRPKNKSEKRTLASTTTLDNGANNLSFEFIDAAFDGTKTPVTGKVVNREAAGPGNPNAIDQINIDAYNSGVEWHRDHVYYGLTPTNPNGKFRNNYSEFITSFKFLTPNALGMIADQDGDPKPINGYGQGRWPGQSGQRNPGWYDGNFEFRITVLINSKNGLGNELVKIISVNPRDLFDLQYRYVRRIYMKPYYLDVYELSSVIPKEFNPNVELLPWDLENYGTAWKFIFYEIDNAQEVTNSFENTTTYAGNFSFEPSFNAIAKLGLKFGASATTTEKRTYAVKTTLTSDFLGEATLSFDQPVIIGTSGSNYLTREITTGNILSISVEPRRVF